MDLSRVVEHCCGSLLSVRIRTALFLALTIVMSAIAVRTASPGALDLSFADRGTAGHGEPAGQFRESEAVVVQPDGKVVTVGWTNTCPFDCDFDFLLIRYNPNGSRDPTWGFNGEVVTDFSRQNEAIMAAAVQSDGKIVVAGGAPDGMGGQNYFLG